MRGSGADCDRFAQDEVPRLVRDADPDLVERYAAQIDAVSALFFEHDPIGIAFGSNADEYDPEARTVVARLVTFPSDLTSDATLTIVHEEFVYWFGSQTAGGRDRYEPVARALFRLWPELAARA